MNGQTGRIQRQSINGLADGGDIMPCDNGRRKPDGILLRVCSGLNGCFTYGGLPRNWPSCWASVVRRLGGTCKPFYSDHGNIGITTAKESINFQFSGSIRAVGSSAFAVPTVKKSTVRRNNGNCGVFYGAWDDKKSIHYAVLRLFQMSGE